MIPITIDYFPGFKLLHDNQIAYCESKIKNFLEVGSNIWVGWWYMHYHYEPTIYMAGVLTELKITAVTRPQTHPADTVDPLDPNVPVSTYSNSVETYNDQLSAYVVKKPDYRDVLHYEIPDGQDIVQATISLQPTTELLFITDLSVDDKKTLIDTYKSIAKYIYVKNITDFQTTNWNWYWTYIQQNFNVITDGTDGVISSK